MSTLAKLRKHLIDAQKTTQQGTLHQDALYAIQQSADEEPTVWEQDVMAPTPPNNYNALHEALALGWEDVAIEIIQRCPQDLADDLLSATTTAGDLPLHWAAEKNFAAVIDCMYDKLPDAFEFFLEQPNTENDATPLFCAAWQGNLAAVERCIKHADESIFYTARAENQQGDSPISIAAFNANELLNIIGTTENNEEIIKLHQNLQSIVDKLSEVQEPQQQWVTPEALLASDEPAIRYDHAPQLYQTITDENGRQHIHIDLPMNNEVPDNFRNNQQIHALEKQLTLLKETQYQATEKHQDEIDALKQQAELDKQRIIDLQMQVDALSGILWRNVSIPDEFNGNANLRHFYHLAYTQLDNFFTGCKSASSGMTKVTGSSTANKTATVVSAIPIPGTGMLSSLIQSVGNERFRETCKKISGIGLGKAYFDQLNQAIVNEFLHHFRSLLIGMETAEEIRNRSPKGAKSFLQRTQQKIGDYERFIRNSRELQPCEIFAEFCVTSLISFLFKITGKNEYGYASIFNTGTTSEVAARLVNSMTTDLFSAYQQISWTPDLDSLKHFFQQITHSIQKTLGFNQLKGYITIDRKCAERTGEPVSFDMLETLTQASTYKNLVLIDPESQAFLQQIATTFHIERPQFKALTVTRDSNAASLNMDMLSQHLTRILHLNGLTDDAFQCHMTGADTLTITARPGVISAALTAVSGHLNGQNYGNVAGLISKLGFQATGELAMGGTRHNNTTMGCIPS